VASKKPVDQAADELYGLPPRELTRARDEHAKRLRGDGDREAAGAVKALRKPTVAAWALNQLARRRPKELGELLAAGERLRAAQEELLAGGGREDFQGAAATERELVGRLSSQAVTIASEGGERGAGLEQKIAETLHAAALHEESADELRAGRLTKEREAIGGFGGLGGALATSAPSTGGPARGEAATKQSAARGEAATKQSAARGEATAKEAAARGKTTAMKAAGRDKTTAKKATGRDKETANKAAARDKETANKAAARDKAAAKQAARERLAGARTDERHAKRELDAATKALAHAQERADAAKAHAVEAAERATKTAERLREARRAETAAKKRHTKAKAELAKLGSDP
jgi:hypothetical protein